MTCCSEMRETKTAVTDRVKGWHFHFLKKSKFVRLIVYVHVNALVHVQYCTCHLNLLEMYMFIYKGTVCLFM
jgi:hypothetical protein